MLRLSLNIIGNSDDKISSPHELVLTNRQAAIFVKVFQITHQLIKPSKTQLSKTIQSGGFAGRLLGPLLKPGLPLTKNVIEPLAESVLVPLRLNAAGSAADAGIDKKS